MQLRLDNLPSHIRKKIAAKHGLSVPAKKKKYNNKPCEMDGIKFDSKAERNQYANLKQLQDSHRITDLQMQVPFSLDVNGRHICKYIADFTYRDLTSGEFVVVDVKGGNATVTPVFRLKAKLMKAVHGIDIQIVN